MAQLNTLGRTADIRVACHRCFACYGTCSPGLRDYPRKYANPDQQLRCAAILRARLPKTVATQAQACTTCEWPGTRDNERGDRDQCIDFTWVPRVTSFSRVEVRVGTTVTVNGSGYCGSSLRFFERNTHAAVPTNATISPTGTQITATVPSGATTGKLGVGPVATPSLSTADFRVLVDFEGIVSEALAEDRPGEARPPTTLRGVHVELYRDNTRIAGPIYSGAGGDYRFASAPLFGPLPSDRYTVKAWLKTARPRAVEIRDSACEWGNPCDATWIEVEKEISASDTTSGPDYGAGCIQQPGARTCEEHQHRELRSTR